MFTRNDIRNAIIAQEYYGFILNTNQLYGRNNGPWPNTALRITEYLFARKAELERRRRKNNCHYEDFDDFEMYYHRRR